MTFTCNDNCPVCGSAAFKDTDDVVQGFSCVRCGDFRIEGNLWKPRTLSQDQMIRISGWVREQNSAQTTPHITRDIFKKISTRALPRLMERAIEALKVFARLYPSLDSWATFYGQDDEDAEILGTSFCKDIADLNVLLELLVEVGWLKRQQGAFNLSVSGLLKLEELRGAGGASAIGFVAMSFDASMNDSWSNGFEPAIRAAGFSPLRISDKEFVGGITDEIMAEIRGARFVIADYTGQKSGVYFEAGFALGLGLTIIPTCRADEIAKLHFDVQHLNTLTWRDPPELAGKLAHRIRAVMGEGPNITSDSTRP